MPAVVTQGLQRNPLKSYCEVYFLYRRATGFQDQIKGVVVQKCLRKAGRDNVFNVLI